MSLKRLLTDIPQKSAYDRKRIFVFPACFLFNSLIKSQNLTLIPVYLIRVRISLENPARRAITPDRLGAWVSYSIGPPRVASTKGICHLACRKVVFLQDDGSRTRLKEAGKKQRV